MIRVYLKISDPSHPYRGAGAYGNGSTEPEARRVARSELRATFGPVTQVTEFVEILDD